MTEAGWTSNDHAINLYTYVLGYHPDQEALEAGDDKDYNAIKRALEHSYQQGLVAGLREAAEMVEDDCYIEGGELLPDYKHRCKHNVNQKELAGKIRFRANDLAQQAQGEKGVGDA